MNSNAVPKKIDTNEVISLSRKLIRTPSITGSETAAGEIVAKKLGEIGLEVQVVGGNVLGKLEGNVSKRTIAICGHLDTVAVVEPGSWTVDPYGAEVKDGKLWGLGSADMKAGLAAQIVAIEAVKRAGVPLQGNILFVATVFEEAGQEKLKHRKGIIELTDKGLVTADAAVIGEPTDLLVGRGHKGVCNIVITVKGKSAHGSVPDKGINAIEKMARVLVALKSLKLASHPELGPGTLTPCLIQGGIKLSIVPDVCQVSIDRRLTVGENEETVKAEMERLFGELKLEDPELNVKGEYPYSYEAVITPSDDLVLKSIDLANRDATGAPVRVGFLRFGTDGAWINKFTRCPVIIYGPGRVSDAHRPNEYVELRQLTEASMVYASLIAHYLS